MQDEKKAIKEPHTKVEVELIPALNQNLTKAEAEMTKNSNANAIVPTGQVILSVTCGGSKLTKADSGRQGEFTEEVFVSVKVSQAEIGKLPNIDVNVTEKCGSKLTKADAGIV